MFNIFSWISDEVQLYRIKKMQYAINIVSKFEDGDEKVLMLLKESLKELDNPKTMKKIMKMYPDNYLAKINDLKQKVEAMETILATEKWMLKEGLISKENGKIIINDLNKNEKEE